MSDPVTNVEDVEDVLSSIRRLVTDKAQDNRKSAVEPAAEAEAGEDKAEALILTSALRINEPTSPVDDTPKLTTPSELESLRRAVSGEFDEEEAETIHHSEPRALSEEVAANWASNPPDTYYEDEPEEPMAALPEQSSDEALDVEPPADEDVAVFDASDENDTAQTDDLDDVAAEDALEVSEEDQDAGEGAEIHQFDAPQDTSEDNSDEATDTFASLDEEADLEASSEQDMTTEDDHTPEHTPEDQSFSSDSDATEWIDETADEEQTAGEQSAEADDDAAEEQVAQGDLEFDGHDEVETVGIASFLRSTGQLKDMPDADVVDDLDAAAMFDDDSPKVDLGDLEDAVIDEDMLRDLVAEIVRQELSGAMGERITRNVRKLVRREIHRAMVAREFD